MLTDLERRALAYLDDKMEASPRGLGMAASGGKTGKGDPMHPLGASKLGGRLGRELHRKGFASPLTPYPSYRGAWYWRITKAGRAALNDGERQ